MNFTQFVAHLQAETDRATPETVQRLMAVELVDEPVRGNGYGNIQRMQALVALAMKEQGFKERHIRDAHEWAETGYDPAEFDTLQVAAAHALYGALLTRYYRGGYSRRKEGRPRFAEFAPKWRIHGENTRWTIELIETQMEA